MHQPRASATSGFYKLMKDNSVLCASIFVFGRSGGRISAARIDSPGLWIAIVEKMHADKIQRDLRSMKPNHFAVAWQMHLPLFHTDRRSQRQMHGANRFFFSPPAGTSNTGNAHTQRATYTPANAFRQRDGHFAAHRAFCSN